MSAPARAVMPTGRLKGRDDGAGAVPPLLQRAGLPDGPDRRSCRARGSPPAPPARPAGRSWSPLGGVGGGCLGGVFFSPPPPAPPRPLPPPKPHPRGVQI